MTNEAMWQAASQNDGRFDGKFFYAVKSTGIFCRPSCKSRVPLKKNVTFFHDAQSAMSAGYRPCKRCRPDLLEYAPLLEIAEKAKMAIDHFYAERAALGEELRALGVSHQRMAEIFRAHYNLSPSEYADRLRIEAAKKSLSDRDTSVLEISLALGFGSMSAFYEFFHRHMNITPGAYRRQMARTAAPHPHVGQYNTAFGTMLVASDGHAITASGFAGVNMTIPTFKPDKLTDKAALQLDEYFAGKRKAFDLPLNPAGTAFQQKVWLALQAIPYGQTRSYKQVATFAGNPNASRAVGMANNKNPLLILVPCHRVIGADGTPVGYAAGLDMKNRLLSLEQDSFQQ